ncbi:adenosylmethionine--8-amino-7-oxononanoate transaminase [Marinicellulosiphila megalodicopiae]|uniref:adenosylmethionine--8-amino-7-oxononanoate transaminase n=1 Tax=Marinicellulosiphila megalodicopiae TaxID=2724896 RepID=UPI003BB171BA
MKNQDWMNRDLEVLWHPCTQMKDHEQYPLIPIKRGKGIYLEDFEGNTYIDAISSWWVNAFGHANEKINKALKNQLDQIEHAIFAGFTHQPGIELAEKLVEITPKGLDKVFYADNGSSGIEVALKMSFHFWQNEGVKSKTKFVNLSNSYHGETLAALAVGDVALYKESYEPLLLKPITVPTPDCYLVEPENWKAHTEKMFEPMLQTLKDNHEEICAVILEPLVQCAGSMRMYHPVYLELLREACDKYNVHFIADEIAVGFGRTGTLFACEQASVTPDIMLLSKVLTGGYLPLCAVMTTEKMYNAFYDDYASLKGFLHSHSYTGNPLACVAALACIDIFQTENIIENNKATASYILQKAEALKQDSQIKGHIAEVRQMGMITAIELVKDNQTNEEYDWKERRGFAIYQYALKHGCLLRPLGNVIYLMPPYIITHGQIDHLFDVMTKAIKEIL